jgi:hypothetical protein
MDPDAKQCLLEHRFAIARLFGEQDRKEAIEGDIGVEPKGDPPLPTEPDTPATPNDEPIVDLHRSRK